MVMILVMILATIIKSFIDLAQNRLCYWKFYNHASHNRKKSQYVEWSLAYREVKTARGDII